MASHESTMYPHVAVPEREKPEESSAVAEKQTSRNPSSDEEIQVTEKDDFVRRDQSSDVLAHGEVKYKSMEWWHVGMLMIAETISLGILSLPSAIAKVGLIPGIILISGLGVLATYAGFVIGQFKLAHPHVLSFADAGQLMFGPIGREILGTAAILSFIFIQAAHILAFSVMMNVLTNHATCSVAFGAIAFVISALLTLPRTLKNVSYLSVASCISIVTAVLIVMISLGVTKKGGENVQLFIKEGSLAPTFVAVLDMMLAFAGNAAFFGFISELKKPHDYPKALFLLQGAAVTFYIIVGTVIYWFVGAAVPSPALSAASPVIRKIAYGIAAPTILVAGVINGHVAATMLYRRIWISFLKKPEVIGQRTARAIISWTVIVTALWLLAWILAEAIPIFNELLGLMSALFMSWFTYGIPGMLWLWMNKGLYRKNWKKMALTAINMCAVLVGLTTCVLGLYTSGTQITHTAVGRPFSCKNNDPMAAGHGNL